MDWPPRRDTCRDRSRDMHRVNTEITGANRSRDMHRVNTKITGANRSCDPSPGERERVAGR